jgi:hypothetical protein
MLKIPTILYRFTQQPAQATEDEATSLDKAGD